MIYNGITYDVGTEYLPNIFSRTGLNSSIVRSDMDAIKNQLHCTTVRVYGKDVQLLIMASEIALDSGLDVWISPRLIDGNQQDTLEYLKKVAIEYQVLKEKYPKRELVFIVGCEMTIDMNCFVRGATLNERAKNLLKPIFFIKNIFGIKQPYQASFNQFLENAVETVLNEFMGKITYAAAIWEEVDWSIFDFISVNLYKASFNATYYPKKIGQMVRLGKPFIVSEFGCCSYEGAHNKGPTGHYVLDYSKRPPVFKEKCIRDETVQAEYITELLDIYNREKVTGAFIFDFYSQRYVYNENPEKDLDMASYAITKSTGENTWEPKESFRKVAEYFKNG
ncbi:MAG: hypothetical protein U0W24_10195 [Bacteroidales bacterium]